MRVKTNVDGRDDEYDTKDRIFTAVSKNLSKRFRLALSAPACSGPLFDDIGYIGNTATALTILEGHYTFPPGTDPATRLLLEEATILYASMNGQEVNTYVTADDYQYYW